jgi:hypothetical protein
MLYSGEGEASAMLEVSGMAWRAYLGTGRD